VAYCRAAADGATCERAGGGGYHVSVPSPAYPTVRAHVQLQHRAHVELQRSPANRSSFSTCSR
jgi:hypothetical protein